MSADLPKIRNWNREQQEQRIAELEQQRDELLTALEATVEAIRLFRNEPQLERLVSLRATAGYVAMDAAMDRGTVAIAKVKPCPTTTN